MPSIPPGSYNTGTIAKSCHAGFGRIAITGINTDASTSLFYNLFETTVGMQVGAYAIPANTTGGSITFDNLPNGTVILEISANGSNPQELVYNFACSTGGGGEPGPPACNVGILSVTVNPGDGETAMTATVSAYGGGTLEYSLDGGPYQSSNVFVVTAGIRIITVREVANPDCNAVSSFTVSEPDAFSVVSPTRDWLPVGQPIYYTFQSPDATPGPISVQIEVSTNGIDFNGTIIAGVIVLPPDDAKQYRANVAPYLEAVFNPGQPILSGIDANLYRLYRVHAVRAANYEEAGPFDVSSPSAHALYATELTPIVDGELTLSKEPYGFNNPAFSGIKTTITGNAAQNEVIPASGLEVCTRYPVQLFWLNRAGGWQTWVFNGKHEYGQEIPEPSTWTDENNRVHRASYPGITETARVFSGFIPLAAYDTVFGILSSIRVYHLENGMFREVNIDAGEYLRHKAGLRRKVLDFGFGYAETLTVQNA